MATELGVRPELKLGQGSPPTSTGPHTVKLLKAKEVKATNFKTKAEYRAIALLLEENGIEMTYEFPLFKDGDKGGTSKPHYLFNRLVGIANGTEVVMELKKEGAITFIDVKIPGQETDDVPVVNLDEPEVGDLIEDFDTASHF